MKNLLLIVVCQMTHMVHMSNNVSTFICYLQEIVAICLDGFHDAVAGVKLSSVSDVENGEPSVVSSLFI